MVISYKVIGNTNICLTRYEKLPGPPGWLPRPGLAATRNVGAFIRQIQPGARKNQRQHQSPGVRENRSRIGQK